MNKFFVGLLLFSLCELAFAGQIPLLLYNYTGSSGNVFIGNAPQIIGPAIGTYGSSLSWTPNVNGQQVIGLQVGSNAYLCYNNTSTIVLQASQYTGDVISIFYGQPASTGGIACGCFGSACAIV